MEWEFRRAGNKPKCEPRLQMFFKQDLHQSAADILALYLCVFTLAWRKADCWSTEKQSDTPSMKLSHFQHWFLFFFYISTRKHGSNLHLKTSKIIAHCVLGCKFRICASVAHCAVSGYAEVLQFIAFVLHQDICEYLTLRCNNDRSDALPVCVAATCIQFVELIFKGRPYAVPHLLFIGNLKEPY